MADSTKLLEMSDVSSWAAACVCFKEGSDVWYNIMFGNNCLMGVKNVIFEVKEGLVSGIRVPEHLSEPAAQMIFKSALDPGKVFFISKETSEYYSSLSYVRDVGCTSLDFFTQHTDTLVPRAMDSDKEAQKALHRLCTGNSMYLRSYLDNCKDDTIRNYLMKYVIEEKN